MTDKTEIEQTCDCNHCLEYNGGSHVLSSQCKCEGCRRMFHSTVEEQKDDFKKAGP
jgi:hypothetical protein